MIDGQQAGKAAAFFDSSFAVKSGLGIGRYSSSSIKSAHRFKSSFFAYTGQLGTVEIDLERPADDMDLMLRMEKELETE